MKYIIITIIYIVVMFIVYNYGDKKEYIKEGLYCGDTELSDDFPLKMDGEISDVQFTKKPMTIEQLDEIRSGKKTYDEVLKECYVEKGGNFGRRNQKNYKRKFKY